MSDKPQGVDFDRQVFVQPERSSTRSAPPLSGLLLVIVGIGVMIFLGYKLVPSLTKDTAASSDPAVADLDKRLAAIEGRLERLEVNRKAAVPAKAEDRPAPEATPAKPEVRTVYKISPAPAQPNRTAAAATDPAMAQRLSNLQQGLGSLQSTETANQEAWQAATNKLADMAGQVGSQGVEILRNQDELNQLLARTEMEAIPFELLRRSNPQLVGPVALQLKSSNTKTQRYTLCVVMQPTCIELKDRGLMEVVQFVVTRNTTPLEVIATKITKDELLGYLEVPRSLGKP